MSRDRRQQIRINDNRLITEIVAERPWASSVVNLNAGGLFTIKPATMGLHGPKIVQVEIPLPEASETVWAKGKVVFEALNNQNVGAGIHFLAMADMHRNLLKDLVEVRRQEMIAKMMLEIKLRKELGAFPTPYMAPPPERRRAPVKLHPRRPAGNPRGIVLKY